MRSTDNTSGLTLRAGELTYGLANRQGPWTTRAGACYVCYPTLQLYAVLYDLAKWKIRQGGGKKQRKEGKRKGWEMMILFGTKLRQGKRQNCQIIPLQLGRLLKLCFKAIYLYGERNVFNFVGQIGWFELHHQKIQKHLSQPTGRLSVQELIHLVMWISRFGQSASAMLDKCSFATFAMNLGPV